MRFARSLTTLALIGLLLSAFLLVLSLTGQISSLKGCGGAGSCEQVLGSRWASLFLIPVSAGSLLLYGFLLWVIRNPNRFFLVVIAFCLMGAALWFGCLSAFVLKSFCPWCTVIHSVGIVSAILLWIASRNFSGKDFPAIAAGLSATALLAIGQVFGPQPDTHQVTQEDPAKNRPGQVEPDPIYQRGEGRKVAVYEEGRLFNIRSLPHLGPEEATHVVVKYFDYTCDSCQEMESALEEFQEQYPDTVCVIVLPVPLNRACNFAYPASRMSHPGACRLARLGLAAWRSSPEQFPAAHEILFSRPLQSPAEAEQAIAELIGRERLDDALQDPWINELIRANTNEYRNLSSETYSLPKLAVGKGRILHGMTRTPEILIRSLEAELFSKKAPQRKGLIQSGGNE